MRDIDLGDGPSVALSDAHAVIQVSQRLGCRAAPGSGQGRPLVRHRESHRDPWGASFGRYRRRPRSSPFSANRCWRGQPVCDRVWTTVKTGPKLARQAAPSLT